MNICVILFNNFETLDVFGPVEIFGKSEDYHIRFYSLNGGLISNTDRISIQTEKLEKIDTPVDILFIPGGMGTRTEINNIALINSITSFGENSKYVITVCTGSALLAKTGLLDGKNATSNKRSFEWVKASSDKVNWIKQARWVVDGKYYTSSGVSAGMDMALGFIADTEGIEKANNIASRIEYKWQSDKKHDDFCNQ